MCVLFYSTIVNGHICLPLTIPYCSPVTPWVCTTNRRDHHSDLTDVKTETKKNRVTYLQLDRELQVIIYPSNQRILGAGLWGPSQSPEQRKETHDGPSNDNDKGLRWVTIDKCRVWLMDIMENVRQPGESQSRLEFRSLNLHQQLPSKPLCQER